MRQNVLPALTGLRAIACLFVMLFHFSLPNEWLSEIVGQVPSVLSSMVYCGYLGVSLFFVLSGFILAYSVDPNEELRAFWLKRLVRIYPAHLLALLFALPLAYGTLLDFGILASGSVIALLQPWHPRFALLWNGPSWSLGAELFFYALFPITLFVWKKIKWPGMAIACACIFNLSVVLAFFHLFPAARSFVATDNPNDYYVNLFRFNPIVRFPEFVIGVGFAQLFRQGRGRASWIWPALALVVIVGLLPAWIPIPYLFVTTGLAPLFGWLILCLAANGCRILENRWFVSAGEASYSAYLFHLPLARYLEPYLPDSGILPFSIFLAILYGFSRAVFRWYESPARRWVRSVLDSQAAAYRQV